MATPILTNEVALTIGKALRFARNELFRSYNTTRDPRMRLQIALEIQSYDLALLWIGSQIVR